MLVGSVGVGVGSAVGPDVEVDSGDGTPVGVEDPASAPVPGPDSGATAQCPPATRLTVVDPCPDSDSPRSRFDPGEQPSTALTGSTGTGGGQLNLRDLGCTPSPRARSAHRAAQAAPVRARERLYTVVATALTMPITAAPRIVPPTPRPDPHSPVAAMA